jgi:hypothetical protein
MKRKLLLASILLASVAVQSQATPPSWYTIMNNDKITAKKILQEQNYTNEEIKELMNMYQIHNKDYTVEMCTRPYQSNIGKAELIDICIVTHGDIKIREKYNFLISEISKIKNLKLSSDSLNKLDVKINSTSVGAVRGIRGFRPEGTNQIIKQYHDKTDNTLNIPIEIPKNSVIDNKLYTIASTLLTLKEVELLDQDIKNNLIDTIGSIFGFSQDIIKLLRNKINKK